jgi:Ca2+-binding EF-hand superfamily protein
LKDESTAKFNGGRLMAEPVLEGASLPEGFEVDETSAYFGVTDSSDIVHQLMSMDRNHSIVAFFSIVSDVVLKPGEFDFEEASKVLNCEGGEIYFLVSGHLGLMSFSDPILHFLGLPNSLGDESPNGKPEIEESHYESLKRLSDPMNILKVLAIAQSTGGSEEVMKYYLTMSNLLQDVSSNNSVLIEIAGEFDSALDVIGHPIPISYLANSNVEITKIPTLPKPSSKQVASAVNQTKTEAVPITKQTTETPPTRQQNGTKESIPATNVEPQISVPLPGKTIEVEEVEELEPVSAENKITDRKAAKVTDNAFEGAFGMMAQSEQEHVEATDVEVEIQQEQDADIESSELQDLTIESEDEIEETFVSDAEMFIQADTNDDGSISPEELAEAAGISVEESQELHKSADKDGDGEMSLSEFVASPVAQKVASNLPRPVAPVRKPVNRTESNTQQVLPSQNSAPRPIPPQNVGPQPVVRTPPPVNQIPQQMPQQVPQQQMWNQPIQPTIRSGINCRGCGIGIDPYWRFCPVCGTQNLN